MPVALPDAEPLLAVRKLVDEYRIRCLWFLRRGYYPSDRDEALRVLDTIQRHADLRGYRAAAEIRRWLSPRSNGPSAGS